MSNTSKVIENSYPDWDMFKNKAAEAVVFSNFAYKQTDQAMQEMANQIPAGYELFLMTDHADKGELGKASFRCAAFINYNTHEIVFTTAGTRPGANKKGLHDVIDDGLVVAHNKPRKMSPAQTLNNMILDSLGEDAKHYKFHYTGHSLGGAMAEMQAVDMDIKLTQRGQKTEKQVSAITFENPGTKPIVEKMYKKAGLPENSTSKLQFYEFNNRSNIINSLNEQTGTTYTIIPDSQKERNPTPAQMAFKAMSKKVGSAVSPLLGKAFELLAPGGVSDKLMSEHKLVNFDKVLVRQEGRVQATEPTSLEKAYTEIKSTISSSKTSPKAKLHQAAKNIAAKMKQKTREKIHQTKRDIKQIVKSNDKGFRR